MITVKIFPSDQDYGNDQHHHSGYLQTRWVQFYNFICRVNRHNLCKESYPGAVGSDCIIMSEGYQLIALWSLCLMWWENCQWCE